MQREKDAREAYQAAKAATKGAAKLLDSPPPLARSCHLLVIVATSHHSQFKIVRKPPQMSPAAQQRKYMLQEECMLQTATFNLNNGTILNFDIDHPWDVNWHAPLLQETVEVKVNREFLGKKEKFAALGISLDGLLEYTEDDTREPTFEVSMFGELFQDMLDTRFGRGLLRAFAVLEKQVRTRPHGGLLQGSRWK